MLDVHLITPITTRSFRSRESLVPLQTATRRVTHRFIDYGPPSIQSEFDEAFALPGTVQAVLSAEAAGADAVVIDCMGDPGVRAAREAVRIPVVGPSEASMHMARMLGRRFGIVTVLESVVPLFENAADLAGLASALAAVRVINIPVLELDKDIDRLHESLREQAERCVREDKADTIILGCTGMMGCAEYIRCRLLESGLDVPVLDPVPLAIEIAECLVRTGLSHSKRGHAAPNLDLARSFAANAPR